MYQASRPDLIPAGAWTVVETAALCSAVPFDSDASKIDWSNVSSTIPNSSKSSEQCKLWFFALREVCNNWKIESVQRTLQESSGVDACDSPGGDSHRKYKCLVPSCDRSYSTEGSLRHHFRTKHPGLSYTRPRPPPPSAVLKLPGTSAFHIKGHTWETGASPHASLVFVDKQNSNNPASPNSDDDSSSSISGGSDESERPQKKQRRARAKQSKVSSPHSVSPSPDQSPNEIATSTTPIALGPPVAYYNPSNMFPSTNTHESSTPTFVNSVGYPASVDNNPFAAPYPNVPFIDSNSSSGHLSVPPFYANGLLGPLDVLKQPQQLGEVVLRQQVQQMSSISLNATSTHDHHPSI